jgi:DNA invertase Pin-like site-specific DNA recombinase
MELSLIRERQRVGIEATKAAGGYNHDRIKLMKSDSVGGTAIARAMGCTNAAIYKVLAAPR